MSIQQEMQSKLQQSFSPQALEVINESDSHNVPANSETHFKVVLVSDAFAGKRSVARHQMIYAELKPYLDGPVHALALHTYTPEEWQERAESAPSSPDCLGGSKSA